MILLIVICVLDVLILFTALWFGHKHIKRNRDKAVHNEYLKWLEKSWHRMK